MSEPENQSFGPDGGTIDCPMSCDVPKGYRLIQVLTDPKPFTIPCPNECGRWVRAVGCPSTHEAGQS